MRLHRLAVVALAALAPAAWPADASYDFVACTHSKRTMLEASPEFVAFGVESWGIVSSSTTKEWERATTHCVGYVRVAAGKPTARGVCKWFDAAGNAASGEFDMPAGGENKFTWLTGTGKFKGIAGAGSFQYLSQGEAQPGTAQDCRRDWGKYSTP